MFRPSATLEHNAGWLKSPSMPHVPRRFLRPSLTEAPFPPPELPGFFGTTSLSATTHARTVSRELSVDP